MYASVLPYAKVLNEGEKIDYTVIKFTGFNSNILVHESYCVNPGCSCADAVLRFIELSDDGMPVYEWFEIRLDMHTWKVTEKKVLNKMIKAEKMIKEFVDNIEEFKKTLLSHFIKAKEYGKKHYIDFMSDSTVKMILDGNVMAHSEIFGSCDIDKFFFEFNGTEKWFFEDQYCSNPKCLCNETVLTFFKIDDAKKTQAPEFAVRMNINNFKYDVEFSHCGTNIVSEIVKILHDSKPEVFGILKRRYNEVKSASKEIIKKFGSNEKKEELPDTKVGRNDPCTCGSGRKYKKCCGR